MGDLSRRTLVTSGLGVAAMFALGGGMKGFEVAVGSMPLLRPPGGQDEAHFIASCIRCDRCRSACPLNCIGVSNMNDGFLNARTAKIDFGQRWLNIGVARSQDTIEIAQGYCDPSLCNHACAANCPTGALKDFDQETDWIAPAVIDTNLCLAYTTGCSSAPCVPACPTEAITFDESTIRTDGRRLPNVDRTLCYGCGRCELVCISTSNKSYSGKRAITVEHTYTTRKDYTAKLELLGAAEADALLDGEAGRILAGSVQEESTVYETEDGSSSQSGSSESSAEGSDDYVFTDTSSSEHGK